jgi:Tol biopolymer transport system component
VFTLRGSGGTNIMVMDTDGSNVANLPKGAEGSQPSWSPDGSKIAFNGIKVAPPARGALPKNGRGIGPRAAFVPAAV